MTVSDWNPHHQQPAGLAQLVEHHLRSAEVQGFDSSLKRLCTTVNDIDSNLGEGVSMTSLVIMVVANGWLYEVAEKGRKHGA